MIVPVPVTKRQTHFDNNPDALDVWLTATELARIDEFAPHGVKAGARYPEVAMKRMGI